jgi:hypothetical protein
MSIVLYVCVVSSGLCDGQFRSPTGCVCLLCVMSVTPTVRRSRADLGC